MEKFYLNTKSEHNEGILLQEYKGKWFLVDARQGYDGKVYKQWGFKQRKVDDKYVWVERNDGTPQPFPWSICIGENAAQAMRFLQAVLETLKEESEPTTPSDDIPF